MPLQLYAGSSFVAEYDRAYIELQRRMQRAIAELRARCEQHSAAAIARYKPFESLVASARVVGLSSVRKMKVDGGARILFGQQDSRLILLAAGEHDAEKLWDSIPNKRAWLRQRIAGTKRADDFGDPLEGRFLSLEPADGWEPYFANEDKVDWLHFLDNEQQAVVEAAASEVEDHLLGGTGILRLLVLGGPGTGKTVVLLKLLQRAKAEKFDAMMECSRELHEHLTKSLCTIIPRRQEADRLPELLVVDDPGSIQDLESIFATRSKSRPIAIVAAFDPLQLDPLPTATELHKLERLADRKPFVLNACYRQRAALAKRVVQMTDALARSNPFLANSRVNDFDSKYSEILESFNTLLYRYPRGAFRTFEHDDPALRPHVHKVLKSPRQWTHCPPLLLVYDEEIFDGIPRSSGLGRLSEERATTISVSQAWRVKGLEFQHALVWLAESTYRTLDQPVQGSGERRYHNRRLLRIIASRARDSLTIVHK